MTTSRGIALIRDHEGTSRTLGGGHHEGNPHVWLDPLREVISAPRLLKRPAAAAFILTVAVFLIGQESVTLPAVIWSYWFSGAINQAAAVTLLMTLVLTPLILVFWWFGRRQMMGQS